MIFNTCLGLSGRLFAQLAKIILFYYNQMVAATDLFESQNPVLRAGKGGQSYILNLSTGQKIRQDKQDEQDYFIFHHGKS
jgi:hypothetical protein